MQSKRFMCVPGSFLYVLTWWDRSCGVKAVPWWHRILFSHHTFTTPISFPGSIRACQLHAPSSEFFEVEKCQNRMAVRLYSFLFKFTSIWPRTSEWQPSLLPKYLCFEILHGCSVCCVATVLHLPFVCLPPCAGLSCCLATIWDRQKRNHGCRSRWETDFFG